MMRTIRLWRDRETGDVWMSGGIAYVAVWLATLVVRLGVEYAATGGLPGEPPRAAGPLTPLSIIASDLLLLSIGLWLARGYGLARRYRELAPVAPPSAHPPPLARHPPTADGWSPTERLRAPRPRRPTAERPHFTVKAVDGADVHGAGRVLRDVATRTRALPKDRP
jgi:hypothetical protein